MADVWTAGPVGAVEVAGGLLLQRPFVEVAGWVEAALCRHGFVVAAAFDLDRDQLAHTGAYLRPYRILLVHNPATTQRILRRDPSAADRAVVVVTVRDTGDGVAVSVPEPSRLAATGLGPVVDGLRGRIREAMHPEE